jgi:hypothetical protein
MCGRIRIIVKKKRRIAIHPDSRQGDVIRNGQYTKFLCESSKAFMFRHAEKNCGNSCVHERYVNIGYNYVPQTMFGRHIVFAPFLITSP